MYGNYKASYTECVDRRTEYAFTIDNLPVIWKSKFKIETDILTIEEDIVVVDHTYRESFIIMYFVDILGHQVGMLVGEDNINVSIHKDNMVAFVLIEILPPKITPPSKHYATKNIWLHEDIFRRGINILKVDTPQHLRDFFNDKIYQIKIKIHSR